MSSVVASSSPADHPRIRGEHNDPGSRTLYLEGSSPHTRGALVCHEMLLGPVTDHPRIRGEHLRSSSAPAGMTGSSPHTRGARDLVDLGVVGAGIIPAYAGSTLHEADDDVRV